MLVPGSSAPSYSHLPPQTLNPKPSTLKQKENSTSHGARPAHLIITMIKWIRTSRLSIQNSLSRQQGDSVGVLVPGNLAPSYAVEGAVLQVCLLLSLSLEGLVTCCLSPLFPRGIFVPCPNQHRTPPTWRPTQSRPPCPRWPTPRCGRERVLY